MQSDNNDKTDRRDETIYALKAMIKSQEKTIRIQDETINVLSKHNEELMKFIRELSNTH